MYTILPKITTFAHKPKHQINKEKERETREARARSAKRQRERERDGGRTTNFCTKECTAVLTWGPELPANCTKFVKKFFTFVTTANISLAFVAPFLLDIAYIAKRLACL